MGMAASQARYLALTARKTNTEWEGQQINQARTALSNQSANLFNQLLGLEVPNPPKETDYTELQYSYEDGENVIENWQQIGTPDANYNYIVTHYYMADVFTGGTKQLQDPQIQLNDVLKTLDYDPATTTVEKDGTGIKVTYKINNYDYNQEYSKVTDEQAEEDEELKNQLSNFESAMNMAKSDGTLTTDAVYGYKDADGTWHFFVANDYNRINETQVTEDEALKKALTKFETEQNLLAEDGSLTYDSIFGSQDSEGNWSFTVNKSQTEDSYTQAKDYVDYSTVYGPSYIGNSKLTELNKLIEDEKTGMTQVTDLAQILRDCPDSAINQYLSFDSQGNLQYDGMGIYTFQLNGKTYYTTEQDLYNSVTSSGTANNTIDTQGKLTYYNAAMISKRFEETNKALLETDGSGRFTSVKFDNDSIVYSLDVKEVTNTTAYEDAMNQYLYKKAQYEKTIADINAQTSIIQQEDRTLELRLKQLDTEQNALSTEMDAVKKVIKDNVEKTFKTFSD